MPAEVAAVEKVLLCRISASVGYRKNIVAAHLCGYFFIILFM